MAELNRATLSNVDISSERVLMSYTYLGDDPAQVIVRVDLADLAGAGGTYTLHVYINDVLVNPDSLVNIGAGDLTAILVSRALPLDANDVLKVSIVGQAGDTLVDTVTSVRNATPATFQDLAGSGQILVDENYGGTDNLLVEDPVNSVTIGGAKILIFLASDYVANRRTDPYIRGQSVSLVDGTWRNPVYLDPGDYIMLVEKPGYYTTKCELSVTTTTTTTTTAAP